VSEPDFLRATRSLYDAMAADYADRFRDELVPRPLDRAMLAAFADGGAAQDDHALHRESSYFWYQ
jgi:hypothetical protein